MKCELELRETCRNIRGVSIDTLIVMDDHLHLIVVLENAAFPLGEIIRRVKAKTSYVFENRLWQPNYYEQIIRSDLALGNIRAYITANPNKEPTFGKRRANRSPSR